MCFANHLSNKIYGTKEDSCVDSQIKRNKGFTDNPKPIKMPGSIT
jgi:hypothetical protein